MEVTKNKKIIFQKIKIVFSFSGFIQLEMDRTRIGNNLTLFYQVRLLDQEIYFINDQNKWYYYHYHFYFFDNYWKNMAERV